MTMTNSLNGHLFDLKHFEPSSVHLHNDPANQRKRMKRTKRRDGNRSERRKERVERNTERMKGAKERLGLKLDYASAIHFLSVVVQLCVT